MSRTIEQAKKRVRQFICGLHGHDALFHFDHRHVSLVCVVCGHESPGWNVPGSASASPARLVDQASASSPRAACGHATAMAHQ